MVLLCWWARHPVFAGACPGLVCLGVEATHPMQLLAECQGLPTRALPPGELRDLVYLDFLVKKKNLLCCPGEQSEGNLRSGTFCELGFSLCTWAGWLALLDYRWEEQVLPWVDVRLVDYMCTAGTCYCQRSAGPRLSPDLPLASVALCFVPLVAGPLSVFMLAAVLGLAC
jgi:hypothetical protein